VDAEVRHILDTCYAEAVQLLTENRKLLDDIAAYLLEKETITGEEMMNIIEPPQEEKQDETPAEEVSAEEAPTQPEEKPEE
jgi:cell division protease FtsH